MEEKKEVDIEIKIDEEIIDLIPFKKEMNIQELRREIQSKQLFNQDFIFLRNNAPFGKNLEIKFNIDKIIDSNNAIKLKLLEENNPPPPIIYSKPINGSTIIEKTKDEKMKYYLYPNITLTDAEEDNWKVILLVGKTGDGKSTFINALVNIYSGIQIEDNFRYILTNENKKKWIRK